jgi:RNA recognition motif-containing protein
MADSQVLNFNKVFIGNIPYDIAKSELESFFKRIGPIKDLKYSHQHSLGSGGQVKRLRLLRVSQQRACRVRNSKSEWHRTEE